MANDTATAAPVTFRPRVLIPCRVLPGWLKDEWIILIDAIDRNTRTARIEVQMFADTTEVVDLEGTPTKKQPVKGWVRVSLAREEGDLSLVVLPQLGIPVGEYLLIEKGL